MSAWRHRVIISTLPSGLLAQAGPYPGLEVVCRQFALMSINRDTLTMLDLSLINMRVRGGDVAAVEMLCT